MRLAADANVILSAVAGKAALKVFTESSAQIHSPTPVLDEVRQYLPKIALQYRMAVESLQGQLRLLAIRENAPEEYRKKVKEARKRIGRRDPDDVDLLALALHLGIPVWSNDKDFEVAGIDWYTTAELLKELGIKS